MKSTLMPTDNELIENIKTLNCETSLLELVERHKKLYFRSYEKFASVCNLREKVQEIYYNIYHLAKNYNPNKKTKFSTYMANQIRFECLNSRRGSKFDPQPPEIINALIESSHQYRKWDGVNLNKTFKVLEDCDERMGVIFRLRHIERLTWRKISEETNIPITTCSFIHRRGIDYLRKNLEKIVD